MVDVAVNLILIETLREQMSDDGIDFGPRRIVGESARVGHHPAINSDGSLPSHCLKPAQLPYDSENHLARAAHLRHRDGELGSQRGIEMVIDHHTPSRRSLEWRLHLVHPAGGIEVEAEHQVGLGKSLFGPLSLFVIA